MEGAPIVELEPNVNAVQPNGNAFENVEVQPAAPNGKGNLVNGNDDEPQPEPRVRLTSEAWLHSSRVRINGVMKARCKYCRKLLGGETSNGTSHLRNHIKTCIQKRIHDGQQKNLGPNYQLGAKPQLSAYQYSSEVSRKELCSMILVHEYPLSIVDHLGFRRFCCSLQSQFTVPCRNTIKNDILALYAVQREKLQKLLDGNLGRVSVTTDLWTASNQKRGYIAVIGHLNDNNWKMRNILLRFMYIPAPHTGDRLAERLYDCLLDWNIDAKLSSITLDNCSTNDSMITELKDKMGRKKSKSTLITTELDHYLSEDVISQTEEVDLLQWWKFNGLKYPTLQAIARDFLAIPITSVASESAFSSSGRLLDPHRSRLHYETIEAMMCTRSWIMEDMPRDSEAAAESMEGLFSAMSLEDSSIEDPTNGECLLVMDQCLK
ncbi:Zinc finger BED domain-containing protein RICESLEEPER 1 [Linum grandiflorum]